MTGKHKVKTAQDLKQSDLAQDQMGRNSLQADDQANVRNQREAVADVKQEADYDVRETYRKMEKHKRARMDLGKGNRKSGD